MTKSVLVATGLMFLAAAPAAEAQVTMDVSKITCDQFVGYKILSPQNIAFWLSGYYNGQRANTTIDVQGLADNARKLQDYCIRNPQVPIMRAVETVFGASK